MKLTFLKRFLPFFVYGPTSIALVCAAHFTRLFGSLRIAFLALTGVISWGFIEYFLHRFIFHYAATSPTGRAMVHEMHLSHHEDPRSVDQLFANLRFSAPIAGVYFLLISLVFGSWQAASYVFAGMMTGYFTYEFLHYQAHHLRPGFRIFVYLKKYHMLHHHQSSETRFGVTSPVFDVIFGTFVPVAKPSANRALTLTR